MPVVDYPLSIEDRDYTVVFYPMECRAEVVELAPKAKVLRFPAKTPQEAVSCAVQVVKAA